MGEEWSKNPNIWQTSFVHAPREKEEGPFQNWQKPQRLQRRRVGSGVVVVVGVARRTRIIRRPVAISKWCSEQQQTRGIV